ncbi:hypothetical protein Trydic_g3692 [Trypoxylus dichotomus]
MPPKKAKQEEAIQNAPITIENPELEVLEQQPPPEPKFLSESEAIYFYTVPGKEKENPEVPPCTPDNIASLTMLPQAFPDAFPSFNDLTVPYVREIGIKACMHVLGEYLHCTNYAFNYLQFWFIDILVDCLWKTQDEYYLCEKEQKIVLEWIVYAFKMIIDPKLCISRKQFFKLFREMIFMAADVLNEGGNELPLPENLFVLVPLEDEKRRKPEGVKGEDSSSSTTSNSCVSLGSSSSTISFSTNASQEIIELKIGDQQRMYTIKRKKCFCHMDENSMDKYDFPTSLTSTFMSTVTPQKDESRNSESAGVSANTLSQLINGDEVVQTEEEVPAFPNKDYNLFHQPDPNLPKRFFPLSPSSSEEEKEIFTNGYRFRVESDTGGEYEGLEFDVDTTGSENKPKQEIETQGTQELWKAENSMGFSKTSTKPSLNIDSRMGSRKSSVQERRKSLPSKLAVKTSTDINLTDAEIMKRLQQFKLWEKHVEDMDDPQVGWYVPSEDPVPEKKEVIDVDAEDWEDLVDPQEISKQDANLYIGFGVLCAIVDFVFDYFYRNLHFTLIKLATRTIPTVITQKLNSEWKVPKATREEFARPKSEKKKPKKEKPPKQPKSPKSSKKEGKKDKGKERKKGSDKKSKKGSEGGKKQKKEKPKKLTKEEKAELDRQRKLQQELETEQLKEEENKRFVFPLADGVTDEFFMEIFGDWQKPKEGKVKNKKKK